MKISHISFFSPTLSFSRRLGAGSIGMFAETRGWETKKKGGQAVGVAHRPMAQAYGLHAAFSLAPGYAIFMILLIYRSASRCFQSAPLSCSLPPWTRSGLEPREPRGQRADTVIAAAGCDDAAASSPLACQGGAMTPLSLRGSRRGAQALGMHAQQLRGVSECACHLKSLPPRRTRPDALLFGFFRYLFQVGK